MLLSSEVDLEIVARGTTGFSGETEKPCYTVHAHLYNVHVHVCEQEFFCLHKYSYTYSVSPIASFLLFVCACMYVYNQDMMFVRACMCIIRI